MDGQRDGWMVVFIFPIYISDKWIHGQMDGWVGGWMDGWMDRCMDD